MPDIAVIDSAIRGMNGALLAFHIAKRWPNLPILFASRLSDTCEIERVLGKGTKIVQKPFRMDELLKQIGDLLESKEQS